LTDEAGSKIELNLQTVEMIGVNNKFQLELIIFPNMDNENNNKICLKICTVHKIKRNVKKKMTLPLKTLPWLRKHMAEILAKHDGTEEIEKEASVQIPQKFL